MKAGPSGEALPLGDRPSSLSEQSRELFEKAWWGGSEESVAAKSLAFSPAGVSAEAGELCRCGRGQFQHGVEFGEVDAGETRRSLVTTALENPSWRQQYGEPRTPAGSVPPAVEGAAVSLLGIRLSGS